MYENEIGLAIASHRKMGVVIFGRTRNIRYRSAVAISLLDECGVSISEGGLTAEDPYIQERLQEIEAVVEACLIRKNREESWVMLGKSATRSAVASLYYTDKTPDREAAVVCLVRSPAHGAWDEDGPRIMKAFGLTRREAQLSLHLSRGDDLREFAAAHFLTINTVKTHLKQIFRKMGVNKQIKVAVAVWAALR